MRTYWLIGEDPDRKLKRLQLRNACQLAIQQGVNGTGGGNGGSGPVLTPSLSGCSNGYIAGPRSSLKNVNINKSPVSRTFSLDSPKKLRFAKLEPSGSVVHEDAEMGRDIKTEVQQQQKSVTPTMEPCHERLAVKHNSCPCIKNILEGRGYNEFEAALMATAAASKATTVVVTSETAPNSSNCCCSQDGGGGDINDDDAFVNESATAADCQGCDTATAAADGCRSNKPRQCCCSCSTSSLFLPDELKCRGNSGDVSLVSPDDSADVLFGAPLMTKLGNGTLAGELPTNVFQRTLTKEVPALLDSALEITYIDCDRETPV